MRDAQIEEFVADLKQVWRDAGEPQFVALAARCQVGKTSLNDAVNRTDRLPTERVLRELLSVIDPKSVDSWVARRAAVHEAVFGPTEPAATTPAPVAKSGPPAPAAELDSQEGANSWWNRGPQVRLTWLHLVAGGTLLTLVSALLTATLVLALSPTPPAKVASAKNWIVGGHDPKDNVALTTQVVASGQKVKYVVADNSDPADTKCLEDAIVFNQRELEGIATAKVIRSKACNAWWARVERVDGKHDGNEMVIRLVDKQGTVLREARHTGDYIIYTRIYLDDDSDVRYCATAVVRSADAEHLVKRVC